MTDKKLKTKELLAKVLIFQTFARGSKKRLLQQRVSFNNDMTVANGSNPLFLCDLYSCVRAVVK
jgi:hypothetical protein